MSNYTHNKELIIKCAVATINVPTQSKAVYCKVLFNLQEFCGGVLVPIIINAANNSLLFLINLSPCYFVD